MTEGFLLTCEIAALLSAASILFSRSIFVSTMLFLSACLAIAGIFMVLDSSYLFIAQIAVYGGGIVVLILFTLLIASNKLQKAKREWTITGLIPPALLVYLIIPNLNGLPEHSKNHTTFSTQILGESIINSYLFPFEVSGILLLVALLAAIIISIQKPKIDEG